MVNAKNDFGDKYDRDCAKNQVQSIRNVVQDKQKRRSSRCPLFLELTLTLFCNNEARRSSQLVDLVILEVLPS